MTADAPSLLGMPRHALEQWFADNGEKPFRAHQLMHWLYQRAVTEPTRMTDLSLALRDRLGSEVNFALPQVTARELAADGVIKWQLAAGSGQAIETVFIPEKERGTLCVSSQVGCALDCSFCATGRQGFNRNLSAAEIIGQVVLARTELGESAISNIVFMGMGEPLANYRPVVQAADILLDDHGFGLSRRRVTISTSGLVPQIRRLAVDARVALAVSLHAPDDALRDVLVPINRMHPIAELLPACWEYAEKTNTRDVTFEYVMLDGINDSIAQARKLVRLLRGHPAKLNLIPFNPFPDSGYARSPQPVVDEFRDVMMSAGVMTMTRKTRGDDIAAACGQLAGRVNNRVRSPLGAKGQRPTGGQVQ